jgi:hypothetical protein
LDFLFKSPVQLIRRLSTNSVETSHPKKVPAKCRQVGNATPRPLQLPRDNDSGVQSGSEAMPNDQNEEEIHVPSTMSILEFPEDNIYPQSDCVDEVKDDEDDEYQEDDPESTTYRSGTDDELE